MDLFKGVKAAANFAKGLFEEDEEEKKPKSALPQSKFNDFFNQTEQLRKAQQKSGKTSALGKTSKSTGTSSVGNMRTSRSEKGVSTKKISSTKFAPDLTGRSTGSSSWDKLKANRGIDDGKQSFSSLKANANRFSDEKKDRAGAFRKGYIDMNNIVSKNADTTFKNTVNSYNAKNPLLRRDNEDLKTLGEATAKPLMKTLEEGQRDSMFNVLNDKFRENEESEDEDRSVFKRISDAWNNIQPHDKPITVSAIDGKAPKGLQIGDTVITSRGGTFKIMGVLSDGSYVTDAGLAKSYDVEQGARINERGEIELYEKALNPQNTSDYLESGGKFDQVTDRYGNPVPREQEKVTLFDRIGAVKDELLGNEKDEIEYSKRMNNIIQATDQIYDIDAYANMYANRDVGLVRYANNPDLISGMNPDETRMIGATDDQKKKYNYLYNRFGKDRADDYVKALEYTYLGPQRAEEYEEYAKAEANEGGAMAIVNTLTGGAFANAILQPVAFVGNVGQGVKNALGIGEYKPIDKNSGLNLLANHTNNYRSKVQENIDKNVENKVAKNILSIGFSAATSGADMLASMLISGGKSSKFVTSSLSMSSANSTISDSLSRGATQEEALVNGFLNGALEYLSELAPVENLFKIGKGKTVIKDAKSTAKSIGQQMGVEAGSEAVANITQNIADSIVMGDKSNYELSVQQYMLSGMSEEEARKRSLMDFYLYGTLEAAAAGALMGGVMGAGAIGTSRMYTGSSIKESAKSLSEYANAEIANKTSEYERSGMDIEDAEAKATEEVLKNIQDGQPVNPESSIAQDIAISTLNANVDSKYRKTANKILNGEKVKIGELANMKAALQESYIKTANNQKAYIYEYVGLPAPNRLSSVFGSYTGRDETGFANKQFTKAWVNKSAAILNEADAYIMSDEKSDSMRQDLEEYMEYSDTLLYGDLLSDEGKQTAYVRAYVNNALNGIEVSAAGTNVISESNDVYADPEPVAETEPGTENATVVEAPVVETTSDNTVITYPASLPEMEEATNEESVAISEVSPAKNTTIQVEREPASSETVIPATDNTVDEAQLQNTALQPESELTAESSVTMDTTESKTQNSAAEDVESITEESSSAFEGKVQGSTKTYHKTYETENKSDLVSSAKDKIGNSNYDIIRVNQQDGEVTFIETDDFDGKTEPGVVSETTVNSEGRISTSRPQGRIIVDKSEYVADDYSGFDVAAQREREHTWKSSGIRYNPEELTDKEYFESKFGELLRIGSTDAQTEGEIEDGRGKEEADVKNDETSGRKLGQELGEERGSSGRDSFHVESGSSGRNVQTDRRTQENNRGRYEKESINIKRGIRKIGREPESGDEKSASDFVGKFGVKVRFFTPFLDYPLGMFDTEENRLYLAAQEDVPLKITASHEIFHYLVKTNVDFKDVRDSLNEFPFADERNLLRSYCREYIVALYDGDEYAVKYFDEHPEKALEEVMANDFSNYLADNILDAEFDFRLYGFQNLDNENIKNTFHENIEYLLKQYFPDIYVTEVQESGKKINVPEDLESASEENNHKKKEKSSTPEEKKTKKEVEKLLNDKYKELFYNTDSRKIVKENVSDIVSYANSLGEITALSEEHDQLSQYAYDKISSMLSEDFVIGSYLSEQDRKFIDYVKNTPIKITDSLKNDITDWGAFYKKSFGKLKLRKNGTPADSVYEEMKEMFPEYTDSSLLTESEIVTHIAEKVDELRGISEKTIEDELEGNIDELYQYAAQISDTIVTEGIIGVKNETEIDRQGDPRDGGTVQERSSGNSEENKRSSDSDSEIRDEEEQPEEVGKESQEDNNVQGHNRELHERTESESVSDVPEKRNTSDTDTEAERMGDDGMAGSVQADGGNVPSEQTVSGSDETAGYDDGRSAGDGETAGKRDREGRPGRNDSERRFFINREVDLYKSGSVSRTKHNIEAIQTLKDVQNSGRKATDEEKQMLAGYTGWGGLSGVFNSSNDQSRKLKELLTKEEYSAAVSSSRNAYYTPVEIIDAVYSIVAKLGITANARILEQSCGNGRFFGYMPQELRDTSAISGVELDPISGNISKLIYSDVDINIENYTKFDQKGYDLIVGNVPFGNERVYDENYRKESNNSLHDYFILKGLEQLSPGGIMAVLTSSSTMDKTSKTNNKGEVIAGARLMMSEKANFIGAVRFPEGVFDSTNVVTDLLIFQKKGEYVDDSLSQDFLRTVDVELEERYDEKSKSIKVNEYFASHPEMVFGTPYLTKNQFGKDVMGVRKGGRDYSTIPDLLPSSIYTEKLRKAADALNKKAREASRNDIETTERRSTGVFNIIDDQIYSFENGKWRPYIPKKKGTDGKEVVDTDKVNRIKGMHQILEAKRELLDIENSESDDAYVQKKIKEFNDLYDKYVVKYGKLNSRKNAGAYGVSPNYGMLQSLEKAKKDKNGKTVYEKEDIFTRRVISPYTEPTSVSNVHDALYASMNLKHSVDLAYMSKLYGKPEKDIIEELGDKLYVNPFDGKPVLAEEYLSGNVRVKLEEAKTAAKSNPEYARNVEALSRVIPPDLQPDEIDASLGASWIAPDIVEKFVNHLFKTNRARVFYNQISAKWSVEAYADRSAYTQWGTANKTPVELITHALNNETPEIRTKEKGLDEKATEQAKAKVEEIKQAFKDWVWVDSERSERLVRTYNDTFNNYVERDVDISHVKSFPGQSNHIKLMPHQLKAALKAIYQKSALFVHTVGAGKTFAMIAAVQEMKRTGVSNKPLLVVPNAKVSDFVSDYNELFPAANILSVGDKDFDPKNIHSTLAKIEQNDYDCIIIRMSSFDRFPISAEAMEEYKDSELSKYIMYLDAAKSENGDRDRNVKEMQRSIDSYQNKLEQMVSEATDNAYGIEVFLDKCGIDSLFVDEAHEYKNLFFPTRQKVAGISKNDITQKSTHMHMVTELMHKRGNHVTFATATPVTNSLAEFYTMMRYLMPDMLESAGVDNFDAWSSVFGQVETKTEMNVTGQAYKTKTRFSKLKNISDLMRMLRQVFDFVTTDDIILATPAARINHIKSPSSTLLYYINQKIDAEDALKDKNGKHNVLANYTLAKMSSMDLRLARKVLIDLGILSPDITNEELDLPDSKVNKAVDRIMMNYENSSDIKGTQIVFLDKGVPKAAKDKDDSEETDNRYDFDLYSDIKTKLIQRGIPAEEIAFIHDFDTDIKKQVLSDKMNDGEIRVLIGSTKKAGTGINVQKRIVALHHLDAPQRPADLTQRNGRGVRQKNMNDEIEINYYSTLNSYDAPQWEMLNRKSTGIESVMKGDPNIREIDDSSLDDTFSGLSVAAANNPVLFELQDIKEKVKKLEAQRSNHMRRINLNQNIIENYSSRKRAVENSILLHENAKRAVDENKDSSMKVGRKTYEKSREASKAAYDLFDSSGQKKFENQVIGKIDGVNILAHQTWESATQNYFLVSLDGIPWIKEMPVSFLDAKGKKAGNKGISALNMFDVLRSELKEGYDPSIQILHKRLSDLESEYKTARDDNAGAFKGEKELNDLRDRQSELEKIMLEAANDNARTFDVEKIRSGDFSDRITTDEALEEQIGYIESGKKKAEEQKRSSASGISPDTSVNFSEGNGSEAPKKNASKESKPKQSDSDVLYSRQSKTSKERAQEKAREIAEAKGRATPLRGNHAVDRPSKDYGKTAEAKSQIKRSERNAAVNIQSVINEIGKSFRVNIFTKRYRKGKGVLGFYDPKHQIIHSQQAQQLGVVIHELGHHIDNQYNMQEKTEIMDMLNNILGYKEKLEENGYTDRELSFETLADFIWHYVTMPDAAYEMGSYAKGKNFYDVFESTVSKEDLKRLKHIRSMVLALSDKGATERVASSVITKKQAEKQSRTTFDSKFDQFMSGMVDSTYKADKIDKQIEEAIGRKLSPSENLQLAFEYAGSASSMAYTIIQEEYMDPNGNVRKDIGSFKSILSDLDKKVTKQVTQKNRFKDTWSEDFNVFLKSMHSIDWENMQKKTISSDLSGDYTGETEHESNIRLYEAALNELRAKYGTLFDDAAQKIYKWNDQFMRDWAVGTGLMTLEDYEHIHEMYPHYVPMFRADVSSANASGTTLSATGTKDAVKRSSKKGSQRSTYPAVDNLIVQFNHIVDAHYKNEIGRNINRMWENDNSDIRDIIGQYVAKIDIPLKRQVTDMSGIKKKLQDAMYRSNFSRLTEKEKAEIELLKGEDKDRKIMELSEMKVIDSAIADTYVQLFPDYYGYGKNTVVFRDGDKIVMYEVLDDSLAMAIRGLEPVQMPKVLELIGRITRAFSAAVTGQNPVFAIRNLSADAQHGYVFTKGRKFDPLNISYLPELIASWGQAFINEFGIKKSVDYTKFRAGTGYGTQYAGEYNLAKKMMRSDSRKINPASLLNLIFRGIVHFNDTNESAARYLAYKRAVKQTEGSSKDKWMAGWKAGREVTTNFHKRGASRTTRGMSRIIPFWNSSVSGLDQIRKLLASKETFTTAEGRLRLARALASQTLFGIIRALSFVGLISIPFIGFGDDDERKKEYDEFNSYMKYGYWMFYSEKYGWVRVNKDRELSAIFGSLAEFIVTAGLNPDYRTEHQIEEFANYMIPLLTIAHEITGSSLFQAMNNKTWYGGQIVKQSEEDKLYPDYYQYIYDDETSYIARFIAKGISKLPDIVQQKLNYMATPKAIDYVMEQMTGIVGDVVLPIFKPNTGAAGAAAGIKNQFTANPKRSNRYTSEMYDIIDMLTAKDSAGKITEEEEKWLKIFNNTVSVSRSDDPKTKTIGDYFKEISEYSSDNTLSAKEKEEKIEKIYDKIAAMSKDIVASYKSGKSPSGVYSEVIIPDDISSAGISKTQYENVAEKILSGGSEEEKYYALIKETSLSEDQKTYIARKLIRKDANYASIKDKYEPLINVGVSVDTIEKVSEATSDYSGKARTLAILEGDYGDDAKQKEALAQSLGGISSTTYKWAKAAHNAGVTVELWQQFQDAYDTVTPGTGRTDRALDAIGLKGKLRYAVRNLQTKRS